MKVMSLNGSSNLSLKKTCAAIGIFDGVHRGHQYLIKQMLTRARRLKLKPIVITFFPHPAHVLCPGVKLGYLSSLKDRLVLLDDLGVEACLVVRFTPRFARIEPQKFIKDILVKKLGVEALFVGDDFRFGKDRRGDITLFRELGLKYGYETHAVSQIKQGSRSISSTRIRKLLSEGKLNEAERLLGRKVSISGPVIRGSRRGRDLGYPTANVAYEADILPLQGVYVVRVLLGKKSYLAIANIGTRPSFEKQNSNLLLEVHILDFSKDIYGLRLQVEFLKKIRNEKKFSNPQDLIQQIQKDEAFARKCFFAKLQLF
ncbi:MAG: bifunctional riboflavin kinase/FAD synthetase [Candidatus Omnitrophica bacterium]|nr:bifunctional riboflavin kinase/FAD synthetase [Candidatus Omnitrophota bacterium]